MQAIASLFRHRHVLFATTLNEVRARYSGTLLGLTWAAAYPFFFLGLYATVYAYVLGVRIENLGPLDYVLLVFTGLIPFIGFSEALSMSVTSVVGNKHLLRNTLFPIELLPVKAVLASSLSMTIALAGLLLAFWVQGRFSLAQLGLIPVFCLQIAFSIGLAWVLSALTVFFRDISQIVGIMILFLMIISPIGYTGEMIPGPLKALAYSNPLYYIIEMYRQILFKGTLSPWLFVGFALVTAALFTLGFALFTRLKPVYVEYV
jgi:lipopolysaccharide transport system permease protein